MRYADLDPILSELAREGRITGLKVLQIWNARFTDARRMRGLPLKSITITNEPDVTLWICEPLRVVPPPPGNPIVAVSPLWNWLPLTLTFWLPTVAFKPDCTALICGVD